MKPRWKVLVELVIAFVLFWIGCIMVWDAMNGGPAWKWLGVIVVGVNLLRLQDRWEEL